MGRKQSKYSEEQWMQRQAQIYHLRCNKATSVKDITELLAQEGREGGFAPTETEVKTQMLAWKFHHGVAWDLDKCPQSFLEYMGIERSPSCSSQCQHSSKSQLCRMCMSSGMAKLCMAPHVHRHDTFVIADKQRDSDVRAYREGPYRPLARLEKRTRMHLDTSKMDQESSSSHSHEPSAPPSRSAADAVVQLRQPGLGNMFEGMPMDFQSELGFSPFADAAHAPNVTSSSLSERTSSQPSGHTQHGVTGYHSQIAVPFQMRRVYNEYPDPASDYESSTAMTGEGHAPSSMPYGGPP